MEGVDILLFANTGTDVAPIWTSIGGQRGAKLGESAKTIDTTTKSSANETFEYGKGNVTISCDGLYLPGDTAVAKLRTALRTKAKIKVRWQEAGTDVVEATALITNFDADGPDGEAATYSCELQVTGDLSLNPV